MGGRRIDDHSFWAGGASKGSVFPEGAKVKHMDSAEGAGALMDYEDSAEKIERQQDVGIAKAERHEQKAGYRN